ncbi:hypothetical protein [Natronorubrum thiooxidans]|nr:hypothetical protein [Natronorubrum thiooxidans]
MGAAAIGGAALFSSSAAASSDVNISATNPETVSTEDGTLSEVTIEPDLTLSWQNFDETVSRARVLVEAAASGSDYMPVFRTTPWYDDSNDEGLSNSGVNLGTRVFGVRGAGSGNRPYADGHRFPIQVANEIGVPDYEAVANSAEESVTEDTYLEGTSVGRPTDFSEIVNHTDDGDGWKFGYYGAASHISDFYTAEDDSTDATTVNLRYTVTLHTNDEYTPLAMYNEYEGHIAKSAAPSGFDVTADSIPHNVLVQSDGHPAITVEETSFAVSVENLPADSDVSGSSNPDASA